MDITWLDPAHLADRDLAGVVAVLEAAREADAPHEFSPTTATVTVRLTDGWDGDPPQAALARDARGRPTALLAIGLPEWDNTHMGVLDIHVDPVARRQGIGRHLFELGAERVRAAGRSLLVTDGFESAAGTAFAKAMGLDRASEVVYRRQYLRTLDWARLDKEYAAAERHAARYELVRMPGAVPDDMVDAVLLMGSAINDRPTDDLDVEAEVFTPKRLRAFEAGQAKRGRRLYRLVARELSTGTLAGQTMVAVLSDRPWHSNQYDTSVVREHRGHRLGLYLKLGMLRWLAEEEPQLRVLDTDNAASNSYMINVNEILGYVVIAKSLEWQKYL